jgi:hypothetical protein
MITRWTLILWHLRFSQRYCYRFKSLRMWHCVAGRVVPDVSMYRNYFLFNFKQFKENVAWPWQWRHWSPFKRPELLAQWQRRLVFTNCNQCNVSSALVTNFSAPALCYLCVSPSEVLILCCIHPPPLSYFTTTVCSSLSTCTSLQLYCWPSFSPVGYFSILSSHIF